MKHNRKDASLPTFNRWSRSPWAAFSSIGREVKIGVLAVGMLFGNVERAWTAVTDYAEEEADTSRLKEIEVIAKRAYPARGISLQSTVYNSLTGRNMPLQTLEAAIKTNPAIDVRERGGMGTQADVSLFGSSPDQTSIMLNGIDFTDARTGHQSNSLPVDIEDIGRISAVTGIIGSGSYSGALNYMTRVSTENTLTAAVTAGDFGYRRVYMSAGMVAGRNNNPDILSTAANGYISCSYTSSDGYHDNTDFNNLNLYGYSTFSPVIAGKRVGDFELQAGFQKRQFGSYGFYSLKYPWQWEQTQTLIASARWRITTKNRYTLSAYISYRQNADLYELYRDGYQKPDWYKGPNHHLTDNIGAGVQADCNLDCGITSVGADITYNHIYSNVLGEEMPTPKKVHGYPDSWYTHNYSRSVLNIWARQTMNPCTWLHFNLSANIVDSRYGTNLMWGATASLHPLSRWSISLSADRTMRLPTFVDLFYNDADHISDTSLKPEKASTYRLSSAFSRGIVALEASAFFRRGTDIIDWMKETADSKWQSLQYGSVDTFGFVASATLRRNSGFFRNLQLS